MSLFIASLNSGSNGNCYYVGSDDEAVLIDAGISCREIEKRMKRLGLLISKVKAIFISHEHTDHISGIKTIAGKYNLPIYITEKTLANSGLVIAQHLILSFNAGSVITIGNLSIHAFIKYHDADDPHSFVVEYNKIKVGVFTDIGFACAQTIHYFKQCHAVFLEANYDEDMLAKGNYPYHLKRRITSGNGHLSNKQAFDLLVQYRPAFMSHIILSHLSKNNNDPILVEELFRPYANILKVIIASRYEESLVYEINNARNYNEAPVTIKVQAPKQLALF